MEEIKMPRNKKNEVQMKYVVDTLTGMVMSVETHEGIIDLRPYGATCDSGYDGMDWDYD